MIRKASGGAEKGFGSYGPSPASSPCQSDWLCLTMCLWDPAKLAWTDPHCRGHDTYLLGASFWDRQHQHSGHGESAGKRKLQERGEDIYTFARHSESQRKIKPNRWWGQGDASRWAQASAGLGLAPPSYPLGHSYYLFSHPFPESWACCQGGHFSNKRAGAKGKENALPDLF